MSGQVIRGSCLCGGAAFEIDGRVSPIELCHCSLCRRSSGSAFSAALLTAVRSLRWLRGRELVRAYQRPTGFLHAFCSRCGSALPEPEPASKVVGIPAGCLDDDPGTRVLRHAHVGSKAPWFEIADEIEQHDTWAGNPVTGDPREIVTSGYDAAAERYNAQRAAGPCPELTLLLGRLKPGARVLDVGCGGGRPVTETLARHADVVGVDISPAQVERARSNVPAARFVAGDIMEQEFAPGSFAAVVAFYALFHIPRDEHRSLLERIARWLEPGGFLLATLAHTSHAGYIERDFFGAPMYWSHFDPDWYLARLGELGFEIMQTGELGHGYREQDGLRAERHPLVLARLRSW